MAFLPSLLFLTAVALADPGCSQVNFCESHEKTTLRIGCLPSEQTRSPVKYSVVFPAGYSPASALPYVVFLHGRGGTKGQFAQFGGIEALSAQPNLVVVTVEEPKHSYWKNGPKGKFQTTKMVADELLGHLDLMLPGEYTKESRGIMGISMGGHGALYVADLYPGKFSHVYAISPIFRTYAELLDKDRPAFGTERQFAEQDPVSRFRRRKDGGKEGFRFGKNFFIEMGRDDGLFHSTKETKAFLEMLLALYPKNVSLGMPGNHNAAFWKGSIPRGLQYMHRNLKPPRLKDASPCG